MVKENIHEMLNQEVNRKEFLKHLGAAAVAVIGINQLVKNFTHPRTVHVRKVTHGYGESAYGR